MNERDTNDTDENLATAVKRSMPGAGAAPSFERVFTAAQEQSQPRRFEVDWLATAVVVAAAITVVLSGARPVPSEVEFVQVAELLGTTSWIAPSDTLLPERDFDLYEDLPTLLESTRPAGGALL